MTSTNAALPSGFQVQRLADGDSDYARFQFPRTDGREMGTVILPMNEAMVKRTVTADLQRAGAAIPEKYNIDKLVLALIGAIPGSPGILTRQPGWTGDHGQQVFVTPRNVYGTSDQLVVFHNSLGKTIKFELAGTLRTWQSMVAEPAAHSTAAATALLASLSGPLLRYSALTESFLINLSGNSSSGKSTANRAALSVWGPPDGMSSWNASDRGLAEVASDNNDLVLVLDDIEQGESDPSNRLIKAVKSLHQLVSGQGRMYAKIVRGENHLPLLNYKTVFLSSSPSTLLTPEGTDGDIVRLLEVAVPHGDKGGIWHEVAGARPKRTAKFSDDLTSGARENHGVAGDLWLNYLVEHQSSLSQKVEDATTAFVAAINPTGSLEARIAKKAGLLYAAALLAVDAGILPWSRETCLQVVGRTYAAFISSANAFKRQEKNLLRKLYKVSLDDKAFITTENAPSEIGFPESGAVGCMYHNKSKMAFKMSSVERLVPSGPLTTKAVITSAINKLKSEGVIEPGSQGSSTKDVRFANGAQKMLVLNRPAFKNALVKWELARLARKKVVIKKGDTKKTATAKLKKKPGSK